MLPNKTLRILVVEDNPADADLIREMLPATGPVSFAVESVARLAEAVTRLERKDIDLVLLDLGLPDSQGLATFQKLRQAVSWVPIIVLSGANDEELAAAAVQEGAQDYLVKGLVSRSLLARAARYALARHRAEAAVRESETLKQTVLDSMFAHIAVLDGDGKIVAVNEAWRRFARENPNLRGLAPAHADVGDNYLAVCRDSCGDFSAEARPAQEGIWQVLTGKSGHFTLEYPCHSPSRKRWFILSVTPFQSGLGGAVLTHTNITERKEAEEALREKEERFRQLAENINEVFWMSDVGKTRMIYVSPAYEKIYGRTCESFYAAPHNWLQAIHPDDRARVLNAVFLKQTAGSYDEEFRIVRPDGTERWIRDRAFPVRDAANKIYRLAGISEDITERKRAEESHARLATAVEQAAESIVITDTSGAILYANPAFEKSSGYTRAEALGQNPRVLKSGKQDADFYRQMWDVLKRGETWSGHFTNRRKDGALYEEEAMISPIRDAAGKVFNYVAVKRDVTHELQIESQIRQSQKMEAFGELAGGVAHDFNNILSVIQLQAGLLKSEQTLTPEQLDFAHEIEKSAQRGADLTRQLLLFSRKQTMQPRNLELKDLVNNIAKMLRRTLGENFELQMKFAQAPLVIHADPGMMDQILLNLTVNARDAMPNGGEIIIETSAVELDEITAAQNTQARPGSFVCLSVTDTGSGIPPEILPRIFEPFFTTKDVGKGTGLGLATVFGIVQQHQGWIHVYSELNRGTTFRVFLPRQTKPSDTEFFWSSPASIPGGGEIILLVEDEYPVRSATCKALTRLGYRVLEASKGDEAVAIWKQHREEIRLLLTDLVMPGGMNGKELAAQLLLENPKLKVIYTSGYSVEVAGTDLVLEEGVNFMAKPFQSHLLAQTIRKRLDQN